MVPRSSYSTYYVGFLFIFRFLLFFPPPPPPNPPPPHLHHSPMYAFEYDSLSNQLTEYSLEIFVCVSERAFSASVVPVSLSLSKPIGLAPPPLSLSLSKPIGLAPPLSLSLSKPIGLGPPPPLSLSLSVPFRLISKPIGLGLSVCVSVSLSLSLSLSVCAFSSHFKTNRFVPFKLNGSTSELQWRYLGRILVPHAEQGCHSTR